MHTSNYPRFTGVSLEKKLPSAEKPAASIDFFPKLLAWMLGIFGSLITAGMIGLITVTLNMQQDVAVMKAQLVSVQNRLVWQQQQTQRYFEIQLQYFQINKEKE